ncbi:hypothetical protein FOA43_003544 [Brettanomyces nanus]|uniref:Protein YTP1-like C-terminal domain-containing protein n=1 Tax=Eeniella nana TaxID=13502 RepID=A0A875S5B9_EENNA|nr:uncharacterized protein FOA43_003544 [Brettanomyces nanus]QPG76158.1 hypothetical protein FOA43_003544 [Brettanomyces nanus]
MTLATGSAMDMGMDDKSPDADDRLASLRDRLAVKMVHWYFSLLILTILPAIAACYAIANRFRVSVSLQIVSGIYSVLEALVLRFPDPDGHENKTSRGTAWFLMFFYGLVLLNGTVTEGTNIFLAKFRDSSMGKYSSRLAPTTYKVISVLIAECGFVKSAMNMVAILGFCYDDHIGQCNAHGIMGMSFIAYGWFMATMLVIPWLRVSRHKHSQEWYDSLMITAWGIVNTFTEHRPWEPWSHHDYQHTSMGIIFWACGMLGIYLSRGNRRSLMPALTLIFTGYAMGQHPQKLILSEKVHTFFGLVLMFGGAIRIMEISFLLHDKRSDPSGQVLSFQYLAPFALVLAGTLFMGANEEQVQLVVDMGADHSAYILIVASTACLVQLFYLLLLDLYLHLCGCSISGTSPYQSLEGGQNLEDTTNSISENTARQSDDHFELDDLSSLDNDATRL